MHKILLLFAICCLCTVLVQSQVREEEAFCRRLDRECRQNQATAGTTDDTVNTYNRRCRAANSNWENITRCQLANAACRLTLIRCERLSCANVRAVLAG